MSRSRMGVGLEEPRGERSWLSKSWNSLQICLLNRRGSWNGGGGVAICLHRGKQSQLHTPVLALMQNQKLLQNFASPHFVASTIFLRALVSLGSLCCLAKCSPTALLGNSVSQV